MSIEVGQVLPSRIIDGVDPEKMKLLSALMRDPNPIHFDRTAVAELGMGDKTVNQGPSNMAYVLSMLGSWAGGVDRITHYRFRFLGNVFEGDRLEAGGVVTAVRETSDSFEVECSLTLTVIDGAQVLTGAGTVTIDKE
ncbi:MaoC family dehydratase [Rhodococcus sp. IEGM 1381]|uniref:MaoC family dehydratase n=1 Tax=Rhodococcus sp. IEGM 1381 TaxID=3047085 RepID=UPI0024B800C7|nr:MaoC family dehydratase [Rhodococcus sp. IEGM 1381]MDI9896140.1 MaoC family dehydratase [Rhodococcus sp. IEGM 1381]